MIIQARCPSCKATLRIPADWMQKAIRCKHCGQAFRAEKKAAATAGRANGPLDIAPMPPVPDVPAPVNPPVIAMRGQRSASSGRLAGKIATGAVAVAVLVGIAVMVYHFTPAPAPDSTKAPDEPVRLEQVKSELPAATGPFPRRILAINIHNYLYFDPIGHGVKPNDVHTQLGKLAQLLHVPASQLFELSDAAPGKAAQPPMRSVIESAVTDFCKTSRSQDRVIMLFSGHAVEVDEQPFLVPIEGELENKNSLIPLQWFFDQLNGCPARQKVLILDVCRQDPNRGTERQSGGPMGEKTDELLKNPPTGIQVWTACTAGQFSYEDGAVLQGGIFLNSLLSALSPGKAKLNLGLQKPQDPLPLAALSKTIDNATETEVEVIYKAKQTPRISGAEKADGAAYDPNAPSPAAITIAWKPAKGFRAAGPGLIGGILRDMADIPPVKIRPDADRGLDVEMFPVFSEAVMKEYAPNNAKTPFRDAITKARTVLKKHAKSFQEVFRGKIDEIKARVAKDQRGLATAVLELNESLEQLEDAAKKRDQEKSRRWQANFDYVHARLLERIAYTFEYNYMLASIRTDSLPELTPEQHTGWRLASRDKMQCKGEEGKQAKKYASDAKEILKKLAEEHRGTPWEVLAKRDILNALGLEWKATR